MAGTKPSKGSSINNREGRPPFLPQTVSARRGNEAIPLLFVACFGDGLTFALLLDAGDHHMGICSQGDMLIHAAVSVGYTAIAEDILGAGTDPNVATNWGEIPLHRAVAYEEEEGVRVVMLLLKAGASIQVLDKDM